MDRRESAACLRGLSMLVLGGAQQPQVIERRANEVIACLETLDEGESESLREQVKNVIMNVGYLVPEKRAEIIKHAIGAAARHNKEHPDAAVTWRELAQLPIVDRDYLRDLSALLDDLAERLQAPGDKEIAPQHTTRVSVLKDPPQVTVDGVAIALSPLEAACLAVIVEAGGDWVSGRQIEEKTAEPRSDRVLKGAANKLGERLFFESARGKGNRLLPEFRRPLA